MIENKELKLEGMMNSGDEIIAEYFKNPDLYCGMHFGCWDQNEVQSFTNSLCCYLTGYEG